MRPERTTHKPLTPTAGMSLGFLGWKTLKGVGVVATCVIVGRVTTFVAHVFFLSSSTSNLTLAKETKRNVVNGFVQEAPNARQNNCCWILAPDFVPFPSRATAGCLRALDNVPPAGPADFGTPLRPFLLYVCVFRVHALRTRVSAVAALVIFSHLFSYAKTSFPGLSEE